MLYPCDEMDDAEFLEFQQELERERPLTRDADSLLHPITPLSSYLADDSGDNVFDDIEDENHEMDVGMELDLDHESSALSNAPEKSSSTKKPTTPKTVAITEVDDFSAAARKKEHRKSRRKDIPKDISVKAEQDNSHQLLLLDQQIVLEQFGVYSDLSGEEEEQEMGCLQNAAVVTMSSVQVTARLVQECHKKEDIRGLSKYCRMPQDCCGDNEQGSFQNNCYEGLRLFANDEDDQVDEKEQNNIIKEEDKEAEVVDDKPDAVDPTQPDIVNHEARDPEEDYEEGIGTMEDEHLFVVNRSFSSFTHQPNTFCQDNCDVMSQYWERIKLALSNRSTDHYQAIDAKSQASLLSCLESVHQQPLERKDSLSYSSIDDDGTFTSPFFPVLEKCHNQDDSFSNEMDKMISCTLPNGLIFCTIWLDHPDYLEQASCQSMGAYEVVESDFGIRHGCQIVWRVRTNKKLVEFPHTTQASDLLRCFSWAGEKDHAVVYQLNQVLSEMRRATEKDCLDDGIEDIQKANHDDSTEDNEVEVVLWTSPTRIFPHFVDVHGNHVSTVHLVREKKKSILGRYACGNQVADKSSFGRIVFFVKTFDSIPSLMSAPSDEMDQGEETILEDSVADDDGDEEGEEAPPSNEQVEVDGDTCPHDEDEHHNEEWSMAGRSHVTTMVDNRTRPQRVRYFLKDETDEEFGERFGL